MTKVLVLFLAAAFAAAVAGIACGAEPDIHDTQEAKTNECLHCHTSAYQAASNPKHDQSFPSTCDDCHNTRAWAPIPKFHELDAVAKKQCADCHQKDYDNPDTRPIHKDRNFPTDCKDCHGTDQFKPLPKDIHTTQTFGKQDCYSCHKSNYDNTTSPNHKQANIPTTCAGCHNAGGAWIPLKTGG